jgi:hypothetical protein
MWRKDNRFSVNSFPRLTLLRYSLSVPAREGLLAGVLKTRLLLGQKKPCFASKEGNFCTRTSDVLCASVGRRE